MAEKLVIVLFEHNQPLNYNNYHDQITKLINERNLLLQVAFDVYDANNDEKISELDLFKCVFHLSKVCPDDSNFQSVLMNDVC